MKADITRRTFRHEQHYIATVQQQGRVPIDADWNEQGEIQQHHDEVEATDIIGPVGFPRGDSFKIGITPDGTDIVLSPGRAYVDGILCENDADPVGVAIPAKDQVTPTTWMLDGVELRVGEWIQISTTDLDGKTYRITAMDKTTLTLTLGVGLVDNLVTLFGGANKSPRIARVVSYITQPELWPVPPAVTIAPTTPTTPGLYLAYLDVWRRHVTALEDSEIREVALGGPDTCTRIRTTWQLRLSAGPLDSAVTCATATLPVTPAGGALAARALEPPKDTPCVIEPTARYRSLENQLYRVEVHDGGPHGTATFKYSIDNGTVVASWLDQDGDALVVGSTGKDSVLRFSNGQWIELIDDTRELAGVPGTLVKINTVEGNKIHILGTVDRKQFPLNPRIRRWDQSSTTGTLVVDTPTANEGFLALDVAGVEVRFEQGTYTTGDYWIIPARTITADVDWPRSEIGTPLAQTRLGIEHHYAKLGLCSWDGSKFTAVTDCRLPFPPLTDIQASDVKIKPGTCDFPSNVKTVQDALTELCKQKENACCELVIVPGDDVQSAIDIALQKNISHGIPGLHVCFAAGTHKLSKTILVTAPTGGGDITISGCGLASHVKASTVGTAIQLVGWTTATVADISISAGVPPPKPKPGQGKSIPVQVINAQRTPSAAVVMLDCGSSVVESAAIECGSATTRVTHCIAIRTSTLPSTSEARVIDCDLVAGNNQVGISLINVDRSTVEGNRIDVSPMSAAHRAEVLTSKGYLGYLRSRMLSELRIGTAASKTVDAVEGSTRNHFTINNVKIAFTSDTALAGVWSRFFAAGGLAKLASLNKTETIVNAMTRERQKVQTPKVTLPAGKAEVSKPAAPPPAPPPSTPPGALLSQPTTGTLSQSDAQALMALGKVPNNLAARVRVKLEHAVTKILRKISNPKTTQAEMASAHIDGFYAWKQGEDASVTATMNPAISIAGGYAGDVRVLDNAISGARTGIRAAIHFTSTGPVSTVPIVSITRARVSGNSVSLTVPPKTKGQHSGVYVGSCASLVIEDNYAHHPSDGGTCTGIRVVGLLGKMMRAEGNHAVRTTVGIHVKLQKSDPKDDPSKNALWILSQNVAQATTTPIIAPPQTLLVHNAP